MAGDADEAEPHASYDHIIGEVLANRYLVEKRLGEGAMGAVYRAKHVKVGRPFAIKVLHSRLLEDKKVLQRFEREAELAGRLRHPNVIGVVDVGDTTDGMRYMVMDFAAGPDLATLLSEAPFPPERIIHLTRQMLEGLYHAHEEGLIHRDFKPENVIVEKDPHGAEVPRIVDFGIAILREGGDSNDAAGRITTNGLVLGTPHYMAPEQAVADPIDHRIDLFALGIMIYEMLSGKLPFDGTGAEVARANLLLDPPPISERVPFLVVDPLLEAFARKLMSKKRDQRPANAKVARDLLDLIAKDREAAAKALGVPLEAARPPQTTQPQAPVRRTSGDGTFPPPIRETPPQAPAMVAATAVAAADQRAVSTASTAPAKKRKAPMIAAIVVGVGIVGTAAAVMLSKQDDPAEVATTQPEPGATETKPAAVEAVAPKVDEPAAKLEPSTEGVGSAKADPTGQAGAGANVDAVGTKVDGTKVDAVGTAKVDPVGTAKVEPPVAKTTTKSTKSTPKTTPKSTATTAKPNATTATTTPKVETKPVETKPVETKPVETKPIEKAEPKVVDAKSLEAQFRAVGAQLSALEKDKGIDAASDLRTRYRVFRINEYFGSQAKLDSGAAILSKLASDIAARKK